MISMALNDTLVRSIVTTIDTVRFRDSIDLAIFGITLYYDSFEVEFPPAVVSFDAISTYGFSDTTITKVMK